MPRAAVRRAVAAVTGNGTAPAGARAPARRRAKAGAASKSAGIWRRLCLTLLIVEIIVALAAPFSAPHDPYQHHPQQRFSPPSSQFPLGTDHLGRDVLSRVIFGAREMLLTLLIALSIATVLGGAVGLVSAAVPVGIDGLVTLLLDIALAIPAVLLAIALIGVLGTSLVALALTLAAIFTPVIARQMRGVAHEYLTRPYIATVRTAGGSTSYIMLRHILPAIRPHLTHVSAIVAVLMISIASALSFLGLARRPPLADWGLMLREARAYLLAAPWMALAPGVAIALTGLLLHGAAERRNASKNISKFLKFFPKTLDINYRIAYIYSMSYLNRIIYINLRRRIV